MCIGACAVREGLHEVDIDDGALFLCERFDLCGSY